MWAPSKRGRLGEESAVHEGHREVRVGLSFNENAGTHEVIANSEPLYTDVKVARRLRQIKESRVSFRKVDAEYGSRRLDTANPGAVGGGSPHWTISAATSSMRRSLSGFKSGARNQQYFEFC
jgi:hypothetical protein